jgi:hypothetical protein
MDRALDCVTNGVFVAIFVHVVRCQDIGKEDRIKLAAFQNAPHFLPERGAGVVVADLVARMCPHQLSMIDDAMLNEAE